MFGKNIKNILFVVSFLIILYGAYNRIFNVLEGVTVKKNKKKKCFNKIGRGVCNKKFVSAPPTDINDKQFNDKFEKAYTSCDGKFDCQTCVIANATILDPNNEKDLSFATDSDEVTDFLEYVNNKKRGNCRLTKNEEKIFKDIKKKLDGKIVLDGSMLSLDTAPV